MEDRWYLAALLRCPQVGSGRMQRLQSVCPAAKDIWSTTAAELRATGALTDAAADALTRHIQGNPNLPERIAEDCRRADVSMVTMEDECYPLVLREIFDPPLVLYY
ncbi:MAG: DNA-protecting protein DprA, partial [Selenomonas sp.]|nr:DNA-protecting protein DprA [Selenomonas sp.]